MDLKRVRCDALFRPKHLRSSTLSFRICASMRLIFLAVSRKEFCSTLFCDTPSPLHAGSRCQAALCIAVLLAALLYPFPTSVGVSSKRAKLRKAADFLIRLYNEDLHLVAEGPKYPQNVTYWIYSDNLLCAYALRPYAPRIAREIEKTVFRLIDEVGMPGKFEVLFGYEIPDEIGAPWPDNNYTVGEGYVIKFDKANGTALPTEEYADLCFYEALNQYLKGNKSGAKSLWQKGYGKFDGRGFYDKATASDGCYANYKLALCLYTAKALGIKEEGLKAVEERLWEMQEMQDDETGGIIALCSLNGTPVGTPNTETTALTLLAYDDWLIWRVWRLNPRLIHPVVWIVCAILITVPMVVFVAWRLLRGEKS